MARSLGAQSAQALLFFIVLWCSEKPENIEVSWDEDNVSWGGAVPRDLQSSSSGKHRRSREFRKECGPLLRRKVEIIDVDEAMPCWEACQNTLSAWVLDNPIMRMQKNVQQPLQSFPVPHPSVFSIPLLIFFLIVATLVESQTSNCFECTRAPLLIIVLCLNAWFAVVSGLFMLAACLAHDVAGATEGMPWADQWFTVYNSMKLPFLSTGTSLLLEVIFAAAAYSKLGLIAYRIQKQLGPCWGSALIKDLIVFAILVMVETLLIWFSVAVCLFFWFLFHAGSHGTVWICAKSASASSLPWLPHNGAYLAGLIYACGSLVHGLLQDHKRPDQFSHTPPNHTNGHCISDAASSRLTLSSKFTSIFADVNLDIAQIVLFLQRGEPFFAFYNISGLIIQVLLFIIEIVRGSLPETTFLSIVLQSDAFVHFRSSMLVGFPTYEFYEKTYREAFGETYVSLTVAVMAIYTVPIKSIPDLALFVGSISLSLSSVKGGVADALEYKSAEEEEVFDSFHARLIPLNHYYWRLEFSRQRKLWLISLIRVNEALAPVITVALCCRCGSVKSTYLCSVAIASPLQIVQILSSQGSQVFSALQGIECAPRDYNGTCDYLRKLARTLILGLLGSLFACIMIFVCICISPCMYLLMYAKPIASGQKISSTASETGDPFGTASAAFQEMLHFTSFLRSKCIFVSCLWCFLLASFVAPAASPFKFHAFVSATSPELFVWPPPVAALHGSVQLGLASVSIISLIVLTVAFSKLQGTIDDWEMTDCQNLDVLSRDCGTAQGNLLRIRADLVEVDILPEVTGSKYLGLRRAQADVSFVVLLGARLVDYTYGPKERPGRVTDKKDPNFDLVEDFLRSTFRFSKGEFYLSPGALAEDVRSMRTSIAATHRTPHLLMIQDELEKLAIWLDGLCILQPEDSIDERVPAGEPTYQEIAEGLESAERRFDWKQHISWHADSSGHRYAEILVGKVREVCDQAIALEALQKAAMSIGFQPLSNVEDAFHRAVTNKEPLKETLSEMVEEWPELERQLCRADSKIQEAKTILSSRSQA